MSKTWTTISIAALLALYGLLPGWVRAENGAAQNGADQANPWGTVRGSSNGAQFGSDAGLGMSGSTPGFLINKQQIMSSPDGSGGYRSLGLSTSTSDREKDWGWLGLVGLVGLSGLSAVKRSKRSKANS
ncbi:MULTISPECIES: WGxxGxxG family protein [Paenibacillus]|uniref:WGxxGxxG family protein n=1 Tax=Paenibacillus TaxID=44249 RepID=UPI0022B8DA96|nr:WGxxGxxG family protein [Paenibacillus caseinilyticus]MCZ8519640.1 WGxxGxxG-CTERM domain-containing protein [Paenibacillus caseinilyticus]